MVIKYFKNQKVYEIEKELYKIVKQRGCDQLFAGLKSFDDDNKALVFARGDCDLKKFAQLR